MHLLNLDLQKPPKTQRPASEFPEPADVYVCDKCGRDLTAHLHRGRAHVRQPLGPVRYFCGCGQGYVSGATEWDYLSPWEKQQWLHDVLLALILLLLLSGYGAVVYFALVRRSVLMLGLSVLGAPFAVVFFCLFVLMLAIPFEIAASVLRTRALGRN